MIWGPTRGETGLPRKDVVDAARRPSRKENEWEPGEKIIGPGGLEQNSEGGVETSGPKSGRGTGKSEFNAGGTSWS